MMVVILTDVFSRRDIGGWRKAIWCVFMIVLPFVGVLCYLIAQHDGMAQRQLDKAQAMQQQFDDHVRTVAGAGASGNGSVAEIERAEGLLARGTITRAEFDALKQRALAAVSRPRRR